MGLRTWLARKILGFDPVEYHLALEHKLRSYEAKYEILVDGMTHQVAEVIILKDKLKQQLEAADDVPSQEWFGAVQNAIKILDERTQEMSSDITHHRECLEYLFSDEKKVNLTSWGLIENNKHNN